MGRAASLTGVLLCAALASGCNRGPAREALAEAEQAIAAGRPQLEAYTPEELAALVAAVQNARERLDEGRYTDALRLAQGLPGRIRVALEEAGRRKGELDAEWAGMAGQLPAVLRGLELKLEQVQAKAPASTDAPDPLTDLRARLLALQGAWSQAESAAAAGRTAQAVAGGRDVVAGAGGLAVRLGFTAVQAAALANAVAAAQAAAREVAPAASPPGAPGP